MITNAHARREGTSGSRRDEILAAARKLISGAGVKATSMRDLAREVGVTEGALYRHFKSKEELVAELFSMEAARLHGWLARSRSGERDPWTQLDSLVEGFVEFGLTETESFRLLMELHETAGLKAGPRVRLPREHFIEVLSLLASSEGRTLRQPIAVVLMIVGMLSRLLGGVRAGAVRLEREEVQALARRAARALVDAATLA